MNQDPPRYGPYPSYLELHQTGELEKRADQALLLLQGRCRVCPVGCRVERLDDEPGECGAARTAPVCSWGPQFGEEAVLRGRRGSGTVFFGGCNLHCVYCQNFETSQMCLDARPFDGEGLAGIFLDVQRMGCHNLNLVTPSHVVPQILDALGLAAGRGFRLPLVYNSSGYDSLRALRLLEGVVDIYMPDPKWATRRSAGCIPV